MLAGPEDGQLALVHHALVESELDQPREQQEQRAIQHFPGLVNNPIDPQPLKGLLTHPTEIVLPVQQYQLLLLVYRSHHDIVDPSLDYQQFQIFCAGDQPPIPV